MSSRWRWFRIIAMLQTTSNPFDNEKIRRIISEVLSAGRLPNCVTFLDHIFKAMEDIPAETLAAHEDIGYFTNIRGHGLKTIMRLHREYPQYLEVMSADPNKQIAKEILENHLDIVAETFGFEALLAAYYLETGQSFVVPNGLRTMQERLAARRVAYEDGHPATYREPSSIFKIQHGLAEKEFVEFAIEQSKSESPVMICGTDEIRALIFSGYTDEVKEIANNYLSQPDTIFSDTNPAKYFMALSGREQGPNTLQGLKDFEEKYRVVDDETCDLLKRKFINGFLSNDKLTEVLHFEMKLCLLRSFDVDLFNAVAVPKLFEELFGKKMFSRASNIPSANFVDPNAHVAKRVDGLSLLSF